MFENFLYSFNNKIYIQCYGGPIGARVTMGAARLVINDWGERYSEIMLRSEIKMYLRALYVDDVRQGTSRIRHGVRFEETESKFVYREAWKKKILRMDIVIQRGWPWSQERR